jgi:putative membrane protein
MGAIIDSFLTGAPFLLLHFFVTLVMLGVGIIIYIKVTPHNEIELIKKGNNAAAVSLAGALVGISLPLAIAMAGSINLYDIILFGTLALFLQLVAYRITDLLITDLSQRIQDGEISAAITMFGIKLSISLINAAAVSV